MSSPLNIAIKQICDEKGISAESVLETIEAALAAAYRKDFGNKTQNIKVNFNPQTGGMKVFDVKTVVSDELYEKAEKEEISEEKILEEKEEGEIRFNPKLHLSLSQAKEIKKNIKIDEIISTELEVPAAFGRMAAQTAKQVIIQKLREAERHNLYEEFKGKEGQIITGVVQRREGRFVLVDLGRLTAIMPPEEQIPQERYNSGSRFKFYIVSVEITPKGPEVKLSRAHPEVVKKMFFFEIPEVASGSVEIKGIAREAGGRSKVAVTTKEENIDPIGSCIGQRGSRIQTIISELGGEKIDIIEWDENPLKFIPKALSPAKIVNIKLGEKEKSALVAVSQDQLSLAIGRAGQNVRLASKLTGWTINIQEIISDEKKESVPLEEVKEESIEKKE